VSAAEPEVAAPPVPALERPGSAKRAWRGVVATVAVGMPVGIGLLWLCAQVIPPAEWDDLQFIAYGVISLVVGLLIVLPIVAFTLGRWLDSRASRPGPVVRFGVAGLVFGLVPMGLAFSDLAHAWAALAYFPVLGLATGALGRALFEASLTSRAWRVIMWLLFGVSCLPLAWSVVVQASGGYGIAA
jgi:hypothetical protein